MFPAVLAIAWLTSLNLGAVKDVSATVQPGDRATFHFSVVAEDGRELANTERRGLPYAVVAGYPAIPYLHDPTFADAFFAEQIVGLSVGEARTLRLTADQVAAAGLSTFVPGGASVRVRILAVSAEKSGSR